MALRKSTDGPTVAPTLEPITHKPVADAKTPKASSVDTMSKADWAAKDYQIVKGGIAHDAATITASMSAMKTDDEVIKLFCTVFDAILAKVRSA